MPDSDPRRSVNIFSSEFSPYDLDGPLQEDMSVLNISWDPASRKGSYVIRMQPGAETIAHEHPFMEEILILEGELIESDGTVLRAGDFVSYAPGSHHSSRTESGCLLLAVDWDPD